MKMISPDGNISIPIFYDDNKLGDFRDRYMKDEDSRSNRPYGNIGYLNQLKDVDLFKAAKCQYNHELGDICVHRDITWHSAGNNISNKNWQTSNKRNINYYN